jgi:hypothetical protein
MGTGLTLARIIERLRNVRLVLLALLAIFHPGADWRRGSRESATARRTG